MLTSPDSFLTASCWPTGVQWHLGQKSPAYLPSHRGYDRYYGYYQGVMDYWTHSATAAAGDPVRAHT